MTVETTTADDEIEVSQNPGTLELLVRSTTGSMEQVSLVLPADLFELIAKAGNVTVRIVTDLSLGGATLRIVAARIVVDGVTVTTAGDLQLRAGTADDATTTVEVTDSTLAGANVEISATATTAPSDAIQTTTAAATATVLT